MQQELQLVLSIGDVTDYLTSQCEWLVARHSLWAVAALVYNYLQIEAIPASKHVSCPN